MVDSWLGENQLLVAEEREWGDPSERATRWEPRQPAYKRPVSKVAEGPIERAY